MRPLLLVSIYVSGLGAALCAQEALQYDARKIEARQAVAAGKYELALQIAEPIAKKAPDDIEVWYTIAQAQRLLGKLEAAEKATQWMLDLRPEFIGGLWEAGLLREQFKDLPGAVDLLNTVYRATPTSKNTERAAILKDIARIFDKQELKAEAAQLRKEIERLKGLEIANEKATTSPTHQ
jgi:tetratricopeptide (TPR) repeat protein